jgi:hypothetical protein
MKSFQMKALALAVLGLGGLVMAGSAFADCPTFSTSTGGTSTPGGGGAWSSQTIDSNTAALGITPAITTGGLAGTSCKLSFTINSGALSNTAAYVTDSSPSAPGEAHYRARFYFDYSALTGLTASNIQFKIFNAFASTIPANGTPDEVMVRLVGGSPRPSLRILVADANQGALPYKVLNVPLPAAGATPGVYYFEFELQQGTTGNCTAASIGTGGCLRYWITPAGTASSDSSATGFWALDNSGWSGVKQVNVGMYATTPPLRALSTQVFSVDEFDSRRQTFIGQ